MRRTASEATRPHFHPLVWPLWLAAGTLAVGSNPLHNLLVLLAAAFVAQVCHTRGAAGRAFGLFIRIGVVVIALRIVFNAIAVGGFSFGETPLGRLPVLGMPWWLGGLSLGGPFTLEMVVSGLIGGLRLLTILAVFGAFNAAADHYGLLRRTPGFLGEAGLAVMIALTFVPQTLNHLAAIRESQRVRGHRFHSWRDALPLITPLIAGGIERSLQLGEAMDSRGFRARHSVAGGSGLWQQVATFGGLALLAIGLFTLFYEPAPRNAVIELVIAFALLASVARSLGKAVRRSRYTRERWQPRDLVVVACCLIVVLALTAGRMYLVASLAYDPLPRASWPAFEPVSSAITLLLATPALATLLGESARPSRRRLPAQQ